MGTRETPKVCCNGAVSEDDCSVCGQWPEADRAPMRTLIVRISLVEEVCGECQMASWRNLGILGQRTRH